MNTEILKLTQHFTSGIKNGACTLLQELLLRQLLWMACRHHILELILAAAYEAIVAPTSGPEVALFSKLQDVWDDLDLNDITLPVIPSHLSGRVNGLLEFIDFQLTDVKKLSRGDYKEYLELAKIYLGGTVERKKSYTYSLQRPGAMSNARWMAKAIYIIKMALLLPQLKNVHWRYKKKIEQMALYVVFCHLKVWFTAPLVSSAASNDIAMYRSLIDFIKVHKKAAEACCKKMNRHTWYLTEELIPLSLFDEQLPLETRTKLAKEIHNFKSPATLPIQKPQLPTLQATSEVIDFVGPRSKVLFELVKVPMDFLAEKDWYTTPEYDTVKKAVKNLSATNDSAERAISLMTTFNSKITRDEESFQDLLQVVEHHRKKYNFKTKKGLLKFR